MGPDELAVRMRGDPALGGLRLMVLHGSRGRGDAGPRSDWDLGVLADGTADLGALSVALTVALGTDAVDVVDLARASALLRFRAARDGIVLHEGPPGEFERFRLEAIQFWCDAGPVIRTAHDELLASL